MRSLVELDLYNNHLTDKSAVAIAECSSLTSLELLDLSGNKLSIETIEALASNTAITNIRDLSITATLGARESVGHPPPEPTPDLLAHEDLHAVDPSLPGVVQRRCREGLYVDESAWKQICELAAELKVELPASLEDG